MKRKKKIAANSGEETGKQPRTSDAAATKTKQRAEEEMRDAIHHGDVDTVRELIATAHQTGLDVNAQGPGGWSALHYACDGGHDEIVRVLLATPGININISDENGYSPLRHVCREGHLSIVQILIERDDIDIDAKDCRGWSPLHWACLFVRVKVARALIAAGASIHTVDNDSYTLLHIASSIGRIKVVQVLIDAPGINLEAKNKRGETSLHVACWDGSANAAAALVAAGANVNAIDHDGTTPLHNACRQRQLTVVEVLLQSKAININARTINRIKSS